MNYLFLIILSLFVVVLIYAFYKRYKIMAGLRNYTESDKLVILTDAIFYKQTKRGVSLVDFWAERCTPCKIQGPIVSQLADEIGDKAKICKFDVKNNPHISKELNIRNVPTIIIFKDGKAIKRFVGVKTKSVLLKAIKEALL